ncbi:MAG: TolC family protein [Pirellulaceae bacterium]
MLRFQLLSSGFAATCLLLAGCAGSGSRTAPPLASRAVVPAAVERLAATRSLPPEPAAGPVRPASFQPAVVEEVAQPLPPVDPLAGGASAGERPALAIDFATALALTHGQNPRVAFAQAQIQQSLAQYEASRVLWLPSLRAGMNYNKHEGRIQDVRGENIETSRGAAYGGLGAGAVGAGSPAVPGVYAQFHLTDAIHQPQIAGHALDAREALGDAAINDQLLETALAYLALLDAMQRRAIAGETEQNGRQLAAITSDFARTGAGNAADADRAATSVALLQNEVARADEAVAVAAARLAQQVSADPNVELVPQEPAVVPIELVSPDEPVGELIALGLANRPELAASRSLVCEAVNRLRREQNAPWLPSVVLGVSYGEFGAGLGGQIENGGDRFDFDGVAYWELRNLGFGEQAARDSASAQIAQARMREVEQLDLVAREVVEAQAQVVARRRQMAVAQGAIETAGSSYGRNLERIRNAQGLPIEVLQSIQALDQARREYLRTVVDYNQAQFRLHRALGWPVSPTP